MRLRPTLCFLGRLLAEKGCATQWGNNTVFLKYDPGRALSACDSLPVKVLKQGNG